jgi:hypothetical protein
MAEPIELSTEPLQEPVVSCDTAIACLARLSTQNGGAARIEGARGNIDLAGDTLTLSRLVKLAAEFGLHAQWIKLDWQGLKATAAAQPLLVVRNDGDVVVVTGGGRSGAEEVSVWDPHHDGVVFFVSREDFERACSRHALTITPVQAEANAFELQPGRDTTPDTAGADSPTHPDVPKLQTPTSPMRTTGASQSIRYGKTSRRRSLRLPFGLVATAILAAAGIALFLLTTPGADHIASRPAPAPVSPAAIPDTLLSGREAASSAGVVAPAPVVGTFETTSASATPPSPEPANKPGEAPPLGAPTQEASPASPPTEAAASGVATAAPQMPQPPATLTTPVPAALPGSVLPASEIAALLAHGDTLFRKGDLAAARLLYERAADAGDGPAAIRLGETFDPVFLDHAQLRGARGDMGKALAWYHRARDLGAVEAEVLLQGLEAK